MTGNEYDIDDSEQFEVLDDESEETQYWDFG